MIPIRILLAGGAVLALLGGAGGLYLKARHDAEVKWKGRVEAAQTQAKVNDVSTQAVDHYTTEVRIVRERQDRAVQAVQAAPGGNDPIPDAVREAWLKGLAGE